MKTMLVLLEDEKDYHFAQLTKEWHLMEKMSELQNKSYAKFQEEIDLMKTLIKLQSQELDKFQYAVDSAENTMKTEDKCYTKLLDDIYSMLMATQSNIFDIYDIESIISSTQAVPHQDEGTQENLQCSVNVYSRENEIPSPGASGDTPKCEGSDRKEMYPF